MTTARTERLAEGFSSGYNCDHALEWNKVKWHFLLCRAEQAGRDCIHTCSLCDVTFVYLHLFSHHLVNFTSPL